jgi:hypothetical protein
MAELFSDIELGDQVSSKAEIKAQVVSEAEIKSMSGLNLESTTDTEATFTPVFRTYHTYWWNGSGVYRYSSNYNNA